MYSWKPIEDLQQNWREWASPELHSLASIWTEQTEKLRQSESLKKFHEKLRREWAIETGIIENLYSIDRGTTLLLIEKGIEASLIPHGSTDKPAEWVVSMIRDQEEALEGIFDFVAQRRQLSTSYIKQLHQVITSHQATTTAMNGFGRYMETTLVRGDWKKYPNNPLRTNGSVHEYCPPEQVASEMDCLIALHQLHEQHQVSPEIEAAWLHHRFTQIHPFQDGNGRMARALASLIFLRAAWFPLVIRRDLREEYISALEQADHSDLQALISLFVKVQKQEFLKALSISEEVLRETKSLHQILSAGVQKLQKRQEDKDTLQLVFQLSQALENIVHSKMLEISGYLDGELKKINKTYETTVQQSDENTDFWYHKQIVELAKNKEYYADTRTYKSWLRLRIREDRQTEIVVSFHGLGREFLGIIIVSAFVVYRNKDDDGYMNVEGPYSVCEEVFQFSYKEQQEEVEPRFSQWLNEAILLGLDQWRRQL